METVGGPDAKKARWSPTSAFPNQGNANGSGNATRDAFANYGYGPQASIAQANFGNTPTSAGFSANALYSTPSLSINTQATNAGMASQLSPNAAAAAFQQQQSQQQSQQGGQASPGANFANFGGYNMLGMGIPAMNMLTGFPYNNQMANFHQVGASPDLLRLFSDSAMANYQQRVPSLNLNIPAAQGPYSPAALSAAMSATSSGILRTVYVGNLPATASVDELLNLVHFGPLENIRVLPEKSCVFLSFLDAPTAAAFHADATVKKLSLHGQELKIGWGKASPVPAQVALAISQSNASRNVYLGGLEENMTEEQLRDDLSRFGLIDQVKIVRDKNIGFVHFLSISVATKVRLVS